MSRTTSADEYSTTMRPRLVSSRLISSHLVSSHLVCRLTHAALRFAVGHSAYQSEFWSIQSQYNTVVHNHIHNHKVRLYCIVHFANE